MTSSKALRDWCRLTCAGYPNVEIRNMSTSFRDGLVFCAIIHRHRPDLIDFNSLSRDDVFQNNKLAFEIAETKLGIPSLLDPSDLLSNRVPDCLSIITYLYQYYHFFNRKSYAGPVSLKPSHVSLLNNLTKSKTPAGLKSRKSLTDLKTCKEDCLSRSRPRTVCSLCLKQVHLIQRYLINGEVYHRSCFRCRVCHSTLLPGSYTRGSEAGFLFCSHHTGDSLENWPKRKVEEGYFSLGGSLISSVPCYTKNTETQDGPVPEGEERDREDFPVGLKSEVKKPPRPCYTPSAEPEPAGRNTRQEVRRIKELSECSSPRPQASDRSRRPVPAPRRMLDPSAAPVPSPRNRSHGSPTAGNASDQNRRSPALSHTSSSPSSNRGSPKVRTNHPWMNIVHPGPWTQLPPAPAPIPAPRTKFSSRYRPRIIPPNPFAEDMVEDAEDKSLSEIDALNPFADDMIQESVDQGRNKTDALNPFAEDMIQENVNRRRHKTVPLNPFAEDMIEDTLDEGPPRTASLNPFAGDMIEDTMDEGLPKTAPLNPFEEDMKTVDESRKPVIADQTKLAVAAERSEQDGVVQDKSVHRDAAGHPQHAEAAPPLSEGADPHEVTVPVAEEVVAVTAVSLTVETLSQSEVIAPHEAGNMRGSLQNVTEAAASSPAAPHEAQCCILPRSLSVPALTSSRCHSSSLPVELMGAQGYDQVSLSESKLACKENPFDRKSGMSKSKTCQSLPSRRGTAPGHGFPLVRRKVQTDQNVSTDDLRSEMRELDRHLQTLEQRGVQLEGNLRDCTNDQQEEQMLLEWFSLVREKNSLVRRDTELIYLAKQQKLEERQADVEYQLRCLLNKPEGDWTEEDRGQEQQLMDELVTIIEERNQIISCLDQDRLREQEEDVFLDAMKTDKELQKEGLKDLKKAKGKFKPTKVFKMLNH